MATMKYDAAHVEQICNLVKIGLPYKHAAAAAGICEKTFYLWIKKHEDFVEALQKAEAEMMRNNLIRIEQAAQNGTWQASAWKLERGFPDLFSTTSRVKVEATNSEEVDDERLEELRAIFNGGKAVATKPKPKPDAKPKKKK